MRAKEYLKLRGLNIEVEKVELSVDDLASIMEQYADGMVQQVKKFDLADVGGNEVVALKLKAFAEQQKDIPDDIQKIINDNFWDLL